MVNAYRANLEARRLSSSTINQRLSAIRKLAIEAADNGFIPPAQASAISRVKGAKQAGIRTGHWLTREQAERLISIPHPASLRAARDRALLAVLIGCGLRRREATTLSVEHIQLRDARWVIVDLIGKGGRVRSVPMPSWTKHTIDAWMAGSGIGISHRAIERAKKLLESASQQVTWLVADITKVLHAVKPGGARDCEHVRARRTTKCSGLDVVRYDAAALHREFGKRFRLLDSRKELHETPFGTVQQFVYCHLLLVCGPRRDREHSFDHLARSLLHRFPLDRSNDFPPGRVTQSPLRIASRRAHG
jgi:integrase